MSWWQNLSNLQQLFWVLGLVSSGFFLLSTALSLLGLGDHSIDLDHDLSVHTDGALDHQASTGEWLKYLSFRNLVAFTLGFSWTGILFYPQLKGLSLLLAILIGFGFATLNHWLLKKLRGLESSGNSNLKEAIGQEARVSVRVDANLAGKGKVIVRVRDRERELLAVTEDTQTLNRGEHVQVYGIEENTVFVSREDRLGIRSL